MDVATLAGLYPAIEPLLRKGSQSFINWITKKAAKEDPSFLLQLQLLQTTSELKSSIFELRSYMLMTSIMSSMLANPELTKEGIKQKFIESGEVASDILSTIERIKP